MNIFTCRVTWLVGLVTLSALLSAPSPAAPAQKNITALVEQGNTARSHGQPQKALDYYQQALKMARGLGNRAGQVHILSNIGDVYSGIGQPQKALDYYRQALPLAHAAGDTAMEAQVRDAISKISAPADSKPVGKP